MSIKPIFKEYASRNNNPNLVFATCDTSTCKDAPAAFGVTAIPNFIAFSNGSEFKNFKGANEQLLNQTVMALSNKVPQMKTMTAKMHEALTFK